MTQKPGGFKWVLLSEDSYGTVIGLLHQRVAQLAREVQV